MSRMFEVVIQLSCLLAGISCVVALDQDLIIDRIQYCLEQGQLMNIKDRKCHSIFGQGPCDDGEWWVQKSPGPSCSGKECKVPKEFITGLGECKPNRCALPKVFYNGTCVYIENASVCTERGKGLVVNLKGETECKCGNGWAQDSFGKCQQLFSQGNCKDNEIFITRTEALKRNDIDVPCRIGDTCKKECEEKTYKYFIQTLNESYGFIDNRCKIEGQSKLGICCPNDIPQSNLNESIPWYLDRLKTIEDTRGICIRNPCPPGQSLFSDLNSVDPDAVTCYEADDSIKTCKDDIDFIEGFLVCPDPLFDIKSTSTKLAIACRRGYFWHRRKKRCVRGYGRR
eukprot:TRINITY_DN15189_c0_g1_i1.p1 TRINITY_DN15189_c0_g1~~TRINITY_DN15189_c0_g1_i1.p1  ORF type:complete len:353 (+),score=31.45 TRINITY_DN15189_c0_g1_i1:39-1061(+)